MQALCGVSRIVTYTLVALVLFKNLAFLTLRNTNVKQHEVVNEDIHAERVVMLTVKLVLDWL